MIMAVQDRLAGRRRAVGNRSPIFPKKAIQTETAKGGCSHCDCDGGNEKYRKGFDASALLQKILPLGLLLFGIGLIFSRSSSSLVVSQSAAKNAVPPGSPETAVMEALSKVVPFSSPTKDVVGNCELRDYPEKRYYKLDKKSRPQFLKQPYLFGLYPKLVNPKEMKGSIPATRKLCVDQSEWYDPNWKDPTQIVPALPFADGTNPSILKLSDNPRIDPSVRELIATNVGREAYYLATICMTNSQCSFNDSPEDIAKFRLSKDENPKTERTIFLVLDRNFATLQEATVYTRIDAQFGRVPPKNQTKTFKLDDARLFTYNGQIWVSYREGKQFGYDKQVLNKLHFEFTNGSSGGVTKGLRTTKGNNNNDNKQIAVTLLASETETLCCGRNMALIDNVHTGKLQALTWVDPVTVVDVDTSKTDGVPKEPEKTKDKIKPKKNAIHGTNGFMVHLPDTGEYLGIGHYHRPNDRNANEYARFGHHYTHTFFTITDQPPHRLKRLSQELVISSYTYPRDAEIIQFWSGLELSTGWDGEEGALLALAYGINDCEGAAIHLDRSYVEELLRDVPEGKQVSDFMKKPANG